MSELRVDNIVDMGGSGAPKLRKGANVTGISTITQAVVGNATINSGGINATGVVTSTSNKFVGDFASGNITAGVITATSSVVASNITINSGGVNASGIVSATSYTGSGANLTGIGLTIAPLAYNPDVSDGQVTPSAGIGLTFNQRVSAGVGTVTLSLVSVGSTVAEVFGLGNATSTTYTVTVSNPGSGNKYYLDGNLSYSPTLYPGNIYTFDQSAATNGTHPLRFATAADAAGSTEYTTGVETNGTPGSAGAYTRITVAADAPDTLYYYCSNHSGMGSNVSIGANVQYNNDADPPNISITPTSNLSVDTVYAISYPSGAFTQSGAGGSFVGTAYTFSTVPVYSPLFGVGYAYWAGLLGPNMGPSYYRVSSPVQITSEINWSSATGDHNNVGAINTDGELWYWGSNARGSGGQNTNSPVVYSSPVQIPGTWSDFGSMSYASIGLKTNGTLWSWGYNFNGTLGLNNTTTYSSPVQIPGTTWRSISSRNYYQGMATKTDGTLWMWGFNQHGRLGHNNTTKYSSPVQIPGTTWSTEHMTGYNLSTAIKTDGTLWTWGRNDYGALGQNNITSYSSPTQIPGTTWKSFSLNSFLNNGNTHVLATKTDGTLWAWGSNSYGTLGQNESGYIRRSSPVQIPGTNWNYASGGGIVSAATKTDGTLWSWGYNNLGTLGQNNRVYYSSPVQIPGTWNERVWVMQQPGGTFFTLAIKSS